MLDVGLQYRLRANSLWLVPMLCLVAGGLLVAGALTVDAAAGYNLLPRSILGTPTAVQTILSTAASAMLTLTTIVLTVMTLGMQFAMQQFSPRIVRSLLSDRHSQLAHGLFAATFVFCMVTVAKVDDEASGGGRVPSVTVVVAYLLLLASVITLVLYVNHAGQSLRVAGLIDLVGDNLRSEIDRLYPEPVTSSSAAEDEDVLKAPTAGVLVAVEVEALVSIAERSDVVIEVVPAIGDFVPQGAALLRWSGRPATDDRLVRCLVLDNERSHIGDPAYGFRKLVDIAERSIAGSPFEDPTTAVQSIDRVHDTLRQLSGRELPSGRHFDRSGRLRLHTREVTWDGYVRLAFDELRLVGAASPQVSRRLLDALDDLLDIAPEERRAPLAHQRQLLDRAVRRTADDDAVGAATVADVQGLGSGGDFVESRADHRGRSPAGRDG